MNLKFILQVWLCVAGVLCLGAWLWHSESWPGLAVGLVAALVTAILVERKSSRMEWERARRETMARYAVARSADEHARRGQ